MLFVALWLLLSPVPQTSTPTPIATVRTGPGGNTVPGTSPGGNTVPPVSRSGGDTIGPGGNTIPPEGMVLQSKFNELLAAYNQQQKDYTDLTVRVDEVQNGLFQRITWPLTAVIGMAIAALTIIGVVAVKVLGPIAQAAFKPGAAPNAPESFTNLFIQSARILTVAFILIATVILALKNHLNDGGAIGILSGVAGYVLGGVRADKTARKSTPKEAVRESVGNTESQGRAESDKSH